MTKDKNNLKNTLEEKLKKISIRGRVAFGIKCIENYASNIGIIDQIIINDLLSQLWEFTTSDKLDEWHEKILEYDPETIIEDYENDSIDNYEYLTRDQIVKYYEAYKAFPYYFNKLVSYVIEIGISNLYGGTGEYSEVSYKATLKAIQSYKYKNDTLPDIEPFEKSKFEEFHGWGFKIDRMSLDKE